MTTIYNYLLETTDLQEVVLPVNAEILTLQVQNNNPCIWAKVDTEIASHVRKFAIFGTGHPIPKTDKYKDMEYIGTYQLQGGSLVFHCFEIFY